MRAADAGAPMADGDAIFGGINDAKRDTVGHHSVVIQSIPEYQSGDQLTLGVDGLIWNPTHSSMDARTWPPKENPDKARSGKGCHLFSLGDITEQISGDSYKTSAISIDFNHYVQWCPGINSLWRADPYCLARCPRIQ